MIIPYTARDGQIYYRKNGRCYKRGRDQSNEFKGYLPTKVKFMMVMRGHPPSIETVAQCSMPERLRCPNDARPEVDDDEIDKQIDEEDRAPPQHYTEERQPVQPQVGALPHLPRCWRLAGSRGGGGV